MIPPMLEQPRGEHWVSGAVLLAVVTICACATPTRTRTESELLPRPGAHVALGEVSNASGHTFDFDPTTLLRGSLEEALGEQDLTPPAGFAGDHFVLSLRITEYRPGNAFKRWLAPGYGSTILAVRGALRDTRSGALAASVVHRRSVHFGGAYTIGAWKTIFSAVADDVAHDLRVRIEQGGEFVVSVTPRTEQPAVPEPDQSAPRVRIARVADERSERGRIGERTAAFGVSMGDVHLSRRVAELMREVLTDDLLAGGMRVVQSGEELSVDADVRKFWTHTDTTALYWDVIAEVELLLLITGPSGASAQRSLRCQEVERTYAWPTARLIGGVFDSCLADLGATLRADAIWQSRR